VTHQCQCGEEFETLTAKRIHQRDDCAGQYEHIEAGDRDSDDVAREATEALLTCQRCERVHDGKWLRSEDVTTAGLTLEIRFTCEHCGFQNVNTAAFEGGAPDA
jgi:hypothetical protein